MRRALLAIALAIIPTTAQAQFEIQDSHTTASFRGIHSIGNGIAWASGTEGTVLRTTDDGKTWQHCTTPPDAEKLDFRGIQVFDQNTAIVMSSGKGDLSRLYKTTDGCKTWKLVFTNPDKDGFWDAIQFSNKLNGVVLGDPILSDFVLFRTYDLGDNWEKSFCSPLNPLKEGESERGAFAASNSSLIIDQQNLSEVTFGTSGPGGAAIFHWRKYLVIDLVKVDCDRVETPLAGSTKSSGIFSIKRSASQGSVIVGGDYTKADEATGTGAFTSNGGKTWQPAKTPPHGYRSSVAYDAPTKTWITVGPNGTDISRDDGRNWSALKPSLQDASDADKNWNALSLPFVVGPKGRIGKLRPDALSTSPQ